MTTLELIERGIGHNCLSDAYDLGRADGYSQAEKDYYKQTEKDRKSSYDCGYQQGRADKYQEIISEYMLLTEKQVADIRADVIDECKKIVMEECITTCEYPFFPNCVECMTNKMEQLKEQK